MAFSLRGLLHLWMLGIPTSPWIFFWLPKSLVNLPGLESLQDNSSLRNLFYIQSTPHFCGWFIWPAPSTTPSFLFASCLLHDTWLTSASGKNSTKLFLSSVCHYLSHHPVSIFMSLLKLSAASLFLYIPHSSHLDILISGLTHSFPAPQFQNVKNLFPDL